MEIKLSCFYGPIYKKMTSFFFLKKEGGKKQITQKHFKKYPIKWKWKHWEVLTLGLKVPLYLKHLIWWQIEQDGCSEWMLLLPGLYIEQRSKQYRHFYAVLIHFWCQKAFVAPIVFFSGWNKALWLLTLVLNSNSWPWTIFDSHCVVTIHMGPVEEQSLHPAVVATVLPAPLTHVPVSAVNGHQKALFYSLTAVH